MAPKSGCIKSAELLSSSKVAKSCRKKQQPLKAKPNKKKSYTVTNNSKFNHHFTTNQKHKFSKLLRQNLYHNTHSPLNSSGRKGKKQGTKARTVASLPKEIATDSQKSKMANLINQHLILEKKRESYHREATKYLEKELHATGILRKLELTKRENGKLTQGEKKFVACTLKKKYQATNFFSP